MFTISALAHRPFVGSSMHHPETRRAERFPKIPTAQPRLSVRVCGKNSGEIHEELKQKFTTGGASREPRPRIPNAFPEARPDRSPSVFPRLTPVPSPRFFSGGGYKGFCDYEEIKQAIKECDGLDGARLEACYAEFGCDVDRVTEHYARSAGIEPKTRKK